MTTEIHARIQGQSGIISLNRPAAIHALTLDMVHAMVRALLAWRDDDAVKSVIIDHAEGRGFCAGGDIANLRDSILNEGGVSAKEFFYHEYQLDHLIFSYPKPVIAFMDGITMGGGVGISLPAQYRIATENTRFAMPETGIGLFPDVGGSWYLSRLEGRVGQYVGLTGARLDGAECDALDIATHYLSSDRTGEAKRRISEEEPDRIEGILGTMAEARPDARLLENIILINQLFASDRLEEIIAALEADGSDWAIREVATIRTKCPQSCKVALRQLVEGAKAKDFAEVMRMEYRIAFRLLMHPDFAEGVRAVIVDKDNAPKWNPATPEAVSDEMIDAIFAPLPEEREWKPL